MFDEKFWLAITFFSFLALAAKYVFPHLVKTLDGKSKKIAEEILLAKELRQKAEKLLLKVEKYHEESASYAENLIKDAEQEAQKLAQESQEFLEKEIEKRTALALERIKFEEEAAIREVKEKIIVSAIERISLGKEFSSDFHNKAIEKSIKNFETFH